MKRKYLWTLIACAVALVVVLAIEASQGGGGKKAVTVDAGTEGIYTPGTYSATAQGFGGPVEVALTIGEKGGITEANITGDGETPDVGGAAIPTLAGQILDAQSAEIDGVSGATFTTNAVKEAAAAALAQAGGAPVEDTSEDGASGEDAAPTVTGPLAAGTYIGAAQGFGGLVEAALTIDDNETITEVVLTGDSETPDVGGAALPTLQEQVLSAQGAEIDGVSGATFTSNAVRQAVTTALSQAAGGGEDTSAAPADGALFIPGTYTGTSTGFGGEVTVTVTVSDRAIDAVEIVGDHETENIGSFAVSMLGERIVAAQSPNIDALTGATVTSNAIFRALRDALTQAGADLSKFPAAQSAEAVEKTDVTEETDIVIIGAGGAGMTAAIDATTAGKKVILLEKMPYAGGNTTKATGGMNAAETHYQAEQGIEDSVEQFIEDTITGGHNLNDRDLVTAMAQNSAAGIDWLDSIGAPLPKVSFSGGATNARIHAPEDGSGVGAFLVTAFLKKVEELGIDVRYDTKATELIVTDGAVTGVKAESKDTSYTINAKAVILTTGGFGSNEDMIVSYRPDLAGTVKTGTPGATGDGIVMAQAVGAALVDIEQIQLHPTVEQSTSMLITESVRGDGAILVNQEGVRFTDELLTRDVVSAAELQQTGGYAYIIFDQRLRDGLKATEKYVSTGITTQADTVGELAEKLDIDPAVLEDTLNKWNSYVAAQNDPDFGRDTGMENDLSVGPWYAIKIAPGIHHTMGGVKIDTSAEVINTDGSPIPGLFAAGEVTGGVHGGNRIGGNAVADIVVFGKIASASAVAYCGD